MHRARTLMKQDIVTEWRINVTGIDVISKRQDSAALSAPCQAIAACPAEDGMLHAEGKVLPIAAPAWMQN